MYVSAPADPSPPSTSNFIPEFPRNLIVDADPRRGAWSRMLDKRKKPESAKEEARARFLKVRDGNACRA